MTGLLKGKVAVVTGGSKGIGYSIAERFTKEGAKVVISSRNKEELEVVANELGSDCFAVDVSDSKSVLSLKEWLVDTHGSLDILVNCAGAVRYDGIMEVTEEDWDFLISVNLTGTFLMCNKLAPIMNDGGAILNISSTLGLRAMEGAVAYCAAKGGVVNLTKAIALDLVNKIRVNCLCPGVVETPMVKHRIETGQATREYLENVQPMGRMGTPEEVASMALHLCGPESGWTTGSIISIDGGQTAA